VLVLVYGSFMTREEFEVALNEFDNQLKKRLPSMINTYLANRGNREYEASFKHLVENLQRQRKALLKDLTKVARLQQKVRYFNAIYNMDSQLRSMGNREALKEQTKMRRHRGHAPVVYDIGEGPEEGEILNVGDGGLLLETTEQVSLDHEIKVSIAGKKARGKAMWSIPEKSGQVETGIKLLNPSNEFMEEVNKILGEYSKDLKNP
jgi:hypothetical protein